MAKILVLVFQQDRQLPDSIKLIIKLIEKSKNIPIIVNVLEYLNNKVNNLNKINHLDNYSDYSKLIITGSGYYSLNYKNINLNNQNKIIKIITSIIRLFKDKPILGICYGMQLLGIANGCKLEYNLDFKRHNQYSKIEIDYQSPIFIGLDREIEVDFNHINSFSLSELINNGFKILAIENKLVAAINCIKSRRENHYGVLFHPERSGVDGLIILENFLNL